VTKTLGSVVDYVGAALRRERKPWGWLRPVKQRDPPVVEWTFDVAAKEKARVLKSESQAAKRLGKSRCHSSA